MKPSILNKIQKLSERHEEISNLLSEPEVINDQNKFRSLSQEYAQLSPIVDLFASYQKAQIDLDSTNEILASADDLEIKEMAKDELIQVKETIIRLQNELQILLLPSDPNDNNNIFLEVRAGTGGDEAAIFAGDLFKMYTRYAESQRWQVEIISENFGEHGGYKEVIARVVGFGAYSRLKFESGVHRVQRVPLTESQGRVHTSAATVAILPELPETEQVTINPADLRIDTFRASGAGGQHVNKTDSAIRITHIPTGIVVECQDERSQHKNKAQALSLLSSKILSMEKEKEAKLHSDARRLQVGSGDRSERIRTYNYPQGRITDHRVNLTLYKLEEIVSGDLDEIINPLIAENQTDLLNMLND